MERRVIEGINSGLAVITWVVLGTLIILPPWFFGGVRASTQLWMALVLAIGLAAAAIRLLLQPRYSTRITPLVLPLVGAMLLGWFQLQSWSPDLLKWLSPTAESLWSEGAETGEAEHVLAGAEPSDSFPISIFPASTRSDLALLAIGIGALVLANVSLINEQVRLLMLGLAAINGAALALFGIVQQITFNGHLFWSVPLRQGGNPFSSYVNRNNAGGYLLICLGASFGVLIWAMLRKQSTFPPPAANGYTNGRRKKSRAIRPATTFLANLDEVLLGATVITVATVAGIVCSLSRGANVALILTILITVYIAHRMKWRMMGSGLLAMSALVGVGMSVWLGRAELLRTRFTETLVDQVVNQTGRLAHWQVLLDVIPNYWRFGSGVGTYRYAYQPYETQVSQNLFYHAENQYLESLVEGGLIGLLLVLATVAVASYSARNHLRNSQSLPSFASAAAFMLALISQTIHAFFDFGLYMPANLVLLGIVCGQGCLLDQRTAYDRPSRWRFWPALVVVVVFLLSIWAANEHRSLMLLERIRLKLDAADDSVPSQQQLGKLGEELDEVLARRPDDSVAHYRRASNWIQLYRVKTLKHVMQEFSAQEVDDQLWKLTSPAYLNRRIHQLHTQKQADEIRSLREFHIVQDTLVPALDHLFAARRHCPVLPKTHLRIAELIFLVADPTDDLDHVRRAIELAPCDPNIQFRAGLLQLQAGHDEEGIAAWRICIDYSQHYTEEILHVGRQLLGPLEVFEKVLGANPERIVQVAQRHYLSVAHTSIRHRLAALAAKGMEDSSLRDEEKVKLLGQIEQLRDRPEAALELFEKAIENNPSDSELRYELSRTLLRLGSVHEAHAHAKYNVRAEPENVRYRRMLTLIEKQRANRTGISVNSKN